MFRQDYIMRLIEQLGRAIRRIAGRNDDEDYEAALADAGRTWQELLDVPRELVEVLDTPALAELLREPVHMRIAAELLTQEARALAGKGDPVHATLLYRRAYELQLEARALDPDGADEAALLELSHHVHANQLDPRYRQ